MNGPSIDYGALSPLLIILGAAIVGVLLEAFLPRAARHAAQLVLAIAALATALRATILLAGTTTTPAIGSLHIDGPALFAQGTLLVLAALALPAIAERAPNGGLHAFTPQGSAIPGSAAERTAARVAASHTEVFPMLLFSLGGMMILPAAGDLITLFIALEILSLPLYVLCGLARHQRLLSHEAAVKYFLLGAFSSAILLYGIALIYGHSGTVELTGIATSLATTEGAGLALLGAGLLAVGLLFKISAAPFHSWTPDVYQGAPTPLTGFMAATTKVAAFVALLRITTVALPALHDQWLALLWAIAALTMAVGTLAAITQSDLKRILAYSAIAHAGFLLTGVLAASPAGTAATLFYLATYGMSTIGAFTTLALLRRHTGDATALAHWARLGRRAPLLAAALTLFLLSFAGIPLTSGFIGKLTVFQAAATSGYLSIVVIGVLASALAALFYLRVITVLYLSGEDTEPSDETATPTQDRGTGSESGIGAREHGQATATVAPSPAEIAPRPALYAVVGITAALTIALGIIPGPLLVLAENAATFWR
ncbi:NADH-quinone oxidoreductase subunit NuoN [Hoyosella sp. G463]|uniref:NADH-quinone oxidoreductase subunit N n=1 Tax=Lolliginicoccus lacisalsi TaxID=2742202 RepID=A0A927JBE2_9ACTN|nr:NADH-quinone oxidoreductase subunit NuoN [Lolliginicoccus lacisalsi]